MTLLKTIFRAWAHGHLIASSQEAFASDPIVAKFLSDRGVDVQGVSSTSRGYSGRKRAATVGGGRGRARGRGFLGISRGVKRARRH